MQLTSSCSLGQGDVKPVLDDNCPDLLLVPDELGIRRIGLLDVERPDQFGKDQAHPCPRERLADAICRAPTERTNCFSVVVVVRRFSFGLGFWEPSLRSPHVRLVEVILREGYG